jgi:antirestriction protein ArdC
MKEPMKETTKKMRGVSNRKARMNPITQEDRLAMIAEAAYFSAQNRGFAPGHELEDWCAAEKEVDRRLAG